MFHIVICAQLACLKNDIFLALDIRGDSQVLVS